MTNDTFTLADAKRLAAHNEFPAVSIHMPTHRVSIETKEDRIRLENMLKEAKKELEKSGMRHVDDFLAPGNSLLDDPEFWRHMDHGLSLFMARDFSAMWRVPLPLEETFHFGRFFQIKPLLPLLTGSGTFYVLALSQNEVGFYRGGRDGLEPVYLTEVPGSLAYALRFDEQETQLQHHTGTGGQGGRRPAVFHGQGVGTDDTKDRILRFCQAVDKGLHDFITPTGAPLVVVADKTVLPIYAQANSYPGLIEQGVTGNPQNMTEQELHTKAWGLVEPVFLKDQIQAAAAHEENAGSERTSTELADILKAAVQGKVDSLFVDQSGKIYGTFDPDTLEVHVHGAREEGDAELLNRACALTLAGGGTVYAVPSGQVPGGGIVPIAALYRF